MRLIQVVRPRPGKLQSVLPLIVALIACGGRGRGGGETTPVSRPPPPAQSAIAIAPNDDPPPPIGFDVKETDVIVTGGFGSAKDRYLRKGDPKPGDTGGATKATLLNEELAPVVVAAIPTPPVVRRAAPPAAPRPIVVAVERTCVEVIRGTSRTNECF
jgi:hypothetical protein